MLKSSDWFDYIHIIAQKCEVSKDPFSNEKTASFNWKGETILFELKNKILKFQIILNYDGELNVIVPKGTELLFKLANGETVKVITTVDAAPRTQVVQIENRVQTQYAYISELTKETINSLSSSKVTFLRFPDTKGGSTDFDIGKNAKKLTEAIFKGAACIKENL
jgi:hypothetical protein